MASILSYVNESLGDNFAILKIGLYSLPVCYCAHLFLKGEIGGFYFWAVVFGIVFLGLITKAINNIRTNKNEIFTINPIEIVKSIVLCVVAVVPQVLIFGLIGKILTTFIKLPVQIPHFQLIFDVIVWTLLGSIVLTSYLCFAKHMHVFQAFNYKAISESCVDILISLLFFIPQLLVMDAILVIPVIALCAQFNLPYTHFVFVLYYSVIFVLNISILSGYLAAVAFEHIKEGYGAYDENYKMNDIIDDIAERIQQ